MKTINVTNEEKQILKIATMHAPKGAGIELMRKMNKVLDVIEKDVDFKNQDRAYLDTESELQFEDSDFQFMKQQFKACDSWNVGEDAIKKLLLVSEKLDNAK